MILTQKQIEQAESDLLRYLNQQFPATVGHIALREKLNDFIETIGSYREALKLCVAALSSGGAPEEQEAIEAAEELLNA